MFQFIQNASTFILIIVLITLTYQDWKSRSVSLALLLVLPLLIILHTYGEWSFKPAFWSSFLWREVVANLLFILLQVCAMWLYLFIRHRKPVNLFSTYFGLGDLLFLVACSFGFYFREFILFVIVGALLAVLVHGSMLLFRKTIQKEVPLVSYYAIVYLIQITVHKLFNFQILQLS